MSERHANGLGIVACELAAAKMPEWRRGPGPWHLEPDLAIAFHDVNVKDADIIAACIALLLILRERQDAKVRLGQTEHTPHEGLFDRFSACLPEIRKDDDR